MRIIRVNRISIKQFNQLQDLGYKVLLTQIAPNRSPYMHYIYNRAIKPLNIKAPLVFKAVVCKCQHIK